MDPKREHQVVSLMVVGTVAIVAVVLMALGLSTPDSGVAAQPSLSSNLAGSAVDYATASVPVGTEFNYAWLDFNGDGKLDYYDFQDVLAGKVDCQKMRCDLNGDGVVDARDQQAFDNLVRRLYDYDNDGKLTRNDPLFLKQIMLGNAHCDANHICDLNGDGLVNSEDITLYTALLYNYDLANTNNS